MKILWVNLFLGIFSYSIGGLNLYLYLETRRWWRLVAGFFAICVGLLIHVKWTILR